MENKTIQVLGSNCPTCKQLLETVTKIAKELEISSEIAYETDVTKMVEMGVMTSPVLAVDGKPVLTGPGHGEEEIREALLKACFSSIDEKKDDSKEEKGACSSCSGCCGGC